MGVFSLFSQSLVKEDYVFFDVETTGLFPLDGEKIIELAMIKTSKGNIVDTYETFINPQMPIPQESTRVNNITNEMVKDAPILDAEMAKNILNFIDNSILVAHNASFDLSFLSIEFGRIGISFEGWKAIDTLKIASTLFPSQRNRLENLIRRYNIMPEGDLHRALVDTDSLRRVFFELLEESEIRSNTIDQLIKNYGFQGQHVHRSIPADFREALVEKKIIKGRYKKRTGENIDLTVLPISPVWLNNRWYLLVKYEQSDNFVTLNCGSFIEYEISK